MQDKNGRPYATFDDLKPGDRVEVDGGFSCIPKGAKYIVENGEEDGLFITAGGHRHYLDGSLDFTTQKFYMGVYKC